MSDCIFCKIIAREIPATVVHENDSYIAFHDIQGQAPTHILCIPKKHYSGIKEMNDHKEMGGLLAFANEVAEKESLTDGYRFVINQGENGGQTVFHTHLHVLGGRKMQWPPG